MQDWQTKEILTAKEASWAFNKHVSTIHLWVLKGLKKYQTFPKLLLKRSDIEEFIEKIEKPGRKKKIQEA